ncbi:hypothetical protein EGW08_013286 [Elysia chlorotica]|uniref:Uncharacterized protein n=1 Tax=Elysia chlorotica TaxID=188477 RepID=A0A3S1B3E5_ELYCH|nr:hypothetical protein EGW08_013286 [Elysia chlorotica]
MSYKPPSDFQQSEETQLADDQPNLEMFLIQVPKTFNIEELNGLMYTPGQIVDVARDDSLPGQLSAVYQLAATALQDLDLKPLVKHKEETVVGPTVSGHLSVTKSYRVETKPSPYTLPSLERPGPAMVCMPTGLRERFTPFGADSPARSRQRSKHRKQDKESTTSSDETPEKRKKKKKKKDKEDASLSMDEPISGNELSASSEFADMNDSQSRLSGLDETLRDGLGQEDEYSPTTQGKRKKKKHKRDKEKSVKESEAGRVSLNGSQDPNSSFAGGDIKGILSSSFKAEKQKKNVSFSLEDGVSVNSSGDAGKFISRSGVKQEPVDDAELVPTMNGGASEKSERLKTGKKRKHSSGYSSADVSLEINSPSLESSDMPLKKKKKKHKATHIDNE